MWFWFPAGSIVWQGFVVPADSDDDGEQVASDNKQQSDEEEDSGSQIQEPQQSQDQDAAEEVSDNEPALKELPQKKVGFSKFKGGSRARRRPAPRRIQRTKTEERTDVHNKYGTLSDSGDDYYNDHNSDFEVFEPDAGPKQGAAQAWRTAGADGGGEPGIAGLCGDVHV